MKQKVSEILRTAILLLRNLVLKKRGENALKSALDLLSLALKAGHIGTWSWDIRTNQINWDKNTEKIFGVKTEEYSRNLNYFYSTIHPDDLPSVKLAVSHSIDSKTPFKTECRVLASDQSVHYIAASGETSYAQDGTPTRMTGVCWDITDTKQAFLDLDRFKTDLERQVQLRTAQLKRSEAKLRVAHSLLAGGKGSTFYFSLPKKERLASAVPDQAVKGLTIGIDLEASPADTERSGK